MRIDPDRKVNGGVTGLDRLPQQLSNQLDAEQGRWQLGSSPLQFQPILNWGGFAKRSFHVTASCRTLHVKLAPAYEQDELRRWMRCHDHLTCHYRAPRVLGWIDVAGSDHGGLVFEHLQGHAWKPRQQPTLAHEIALMLDRLHHDEDLAIQLGDPLRSYRQCWDMRFREQFEEDLKIVRAQRPPFVTGASLEWMEQESRKLLAMGQDHPALEGMTRAPCHWDLWSENVMVGDDGDWWVLDWDGLAIGDQAVDFATLAWSGVFEEGRDWRDVLGRDFDPALAARIDLYLRGIMLDWTIDVLADWIVCDVPEWRDQVRARNEALHLRHLDWYRQRWD